jgi:hypothetical protein
MFIMFQYLPQKTAEIPELHPQRLLGLTIVEDVVLESQQFFGEDIGT